MTLDEIPSGTRVFVDAAIFIYHFTEASADCRRFLERCELGELRGATSVIVLAEVTHRLMMIEAIKTGLVSPGNVVKKLRQAPEIVRKLHIYQDQVERIPLMGIDVLPVDLRALIRSSVLRNTYGLLTNDSLVAAAAKNEGIHYLASADRDFDRLEELQVCNPIAIS